MINSNSASYPVLGAARAVGVSYSFALKVLEFLKRSVGNEHEGFCWSEPEATTDQYLCLVVMLSDAKHEGRLA